MLHIMSFAKKKGEEQINKKSEGITERRKT